LVYHNTSRLKDGRIKTKTPLQTKEREGQYNASDNLFKIKSYMK